MKFNLIKSSQKKVIPRLFGGLGNQLFIYAAARRIALYNNAELILDTKSGFSYDFTHHRNYQLDHFKISCRKATARECLEPFSRIRRYLIRQWNSRLPFEQRYYICQEGSDFDARLLRVKLHENLYLEGYWQSENYFKDFETIIRQDLQIIPPNDDANLMIAERIRCCNSIAVHIRFFEEPNSGGTENTSEYYYRRAIDEIEFRFPNSHYFLFSDHPEIARNLIPLSEDRITIVSHNKGDALAYADLWLMSQCQHFIIANSTFSWWGAWLSDNTEKLVIAPGLNGEMGRAWGYKGQIPKSWLTL